MPGAARRDSGSSSDHEETKVSLKKRKTTDSAFVPTFKQDLSSDDNDVDNDDDDDEAEGEGEDAPNDQTDAIDARSTRGKKRVPIKTLTKAELEAVNAAKSRTGVLYLSKVPPFMKPQKVTHLLSQYGETGRIFLAPEDPKSYAKRVRFGGNKRRMFTEGWIEFLDKRKAKLVAETLNCRKIGGKKTSFYHDDLWNLKYLPKFKWDDLTAQIAAEAASRQARLAAEIEQAKREAGHFLKTTERAKMIADIQKTRASKRMQGEHHKDAGAGRARESGEALDGQDEGEGKARRHFTQHNVRDKTATAVQQDEKLTRVMDDIFG